MAGLDYIVKSFEESLARFREILEEPETIANRDSAIKRFELTVELAWKALQKFLAREGIVAKSPRQSFREAFKQGLLPDNEGWLGMIEDRNQTVHAYNEKTAERSLWPFERVSG